MHESRGLRGWEGERVRLVPLDRERHLDNCVRWMNDPDVHRWLMAGDFPVLSKAREEDWFEQASKSEREVHFAIETLDGIHIGQTGIQAIDLRHRTAVTGSFIGDLAYRGQGYGSDAARVRTRYAFEVLNLRLLLACTLGGNEPSHRMLTSLGYREMGRIPRRFYRNGAYRDEIMLALYREDTEWAEKPGPSEKYTDGQ